MLAKLPAHLLEGRIGDIVAGVQLDDPRVHLFGLVEISEVRLEQASGTEQKALANLLPFTVGVLDLVRRHDERLRDLRRVATQLRSLVESRRGCFVVWRDDESVDSFSELAFGDLRFGPFRRGRAPQGLEGFEHRASVFGALVRIARQQVHDELRHVLGHPTAWRRRVGRLRILREVRKCIVDPLLDSEQRLAREDLVHHGANRVDITPRVRRQPPKLLRRRPFRITHDDKGIVAVGSPPHRTQSVERRVNEQHPLLARLGAASDQQVGQLDVAVGQPLLVDGDERIEQTMKKSSGLVDVHRSASRGTRLHSLSIHQVVRDVVEPFLLPNAQASRQPFMLHASVQATRHREAREGGAVLDQPRPENLQDHFLLITLGEVD